jgi:uncharacterized protein YkwD
MLNAHSTYRSQHKVDALRQNSTMDASAQAHANYLAVNNLFQHSGNLGD